MIELAKLGEIALGGVVGFASAIFAEPLRRRIWAPSLRLQFGDGPEYRARTPLGLSIIRNGQAHPVKNDIECEFLRIKVENRSKTGTVAQKCRAYLVQVERQQMDGSFKPTAFYESIPLAWSCRDDTDSYGPVDLAVGVQQFIDVLAVQSDSNEFCLKIKPMPLRYAGLMRDTGTFRFTVQVCGENFLPATLQVIFSWQGSWEKFVACATPS